MARAERELVLVDGRSGAGKTQWATEMARSTGLLLISLDDVYPGWDGLDAGHWRIYRECILPWSQGQLGVLRRWDWQTMAPGSEITVSPDSSLIIEGCGALSTWTSPHATSRYWIDADDSVRRRRALDRDGAMFAPHWQRWALQEERFYALHRSRELADSIIPT